MKRLSRYFLEGLLVLVPLVVTIYVITVIFLKIDHLFNFTTPGLGVAATLLLITLVGFVASNFLTRKLVRLIETLFTRLPLIKMIYSSIKDLVNAFVGDKKSFNRPVLVSLSADNGIQAVGFITRDNLEHIGISGRMAVYFPQSYNFAGNLVVVPNERVFPLDADPGDVMSFVVSGGISEAGNKRTIKTVDSGRKKQC
ncbi:MAG: DUF502 domain-containing protein [Desulfobacterales bacterium]|nr:DUF502 domain-containing protein [Desulfobacterales bacterium]